MGAPERTTRVANRMIGAALGLRIPSKPSKGARDVASPAPVVDAWDD